MTADLAIVGGGVIGAWAARLAARRHPDRRIVVLERRAAVGHGTTRYSAGVSFPLAATPGHLPLVRAARSAYAALAGTAAGECVRDLPILYVTAAPDRLAARLVDSTLRPATSAERAALKALLPDLRIGADDVVLGQDRPVFAVAAGALTETLLRTSGARVVTDFEVTEVHRWDDGYRLAGPAGEYRARRVLLGCGPWPLPTGIPRPLPEASGVRRKRIAALHVRTPTTAEVPLVSFVDDDVFVLPTAPGQALVSFYREEWDPDPDRMDGSPAAADLAAGRAALAARSPSLADAVTGGRAFCDLYAPGRLPRVTTDPELPSLVAVRGGSGSGVRLGPGLAAAALDALEATGPDPDPDPDPDQHPFPDDFAVERLP